MTAELDMTRIPQHIAIIMDGNGRWAMERGKERTYGHQAGVEAVRSRSIPSLLKTGTAPMMRWLHLWDWFSLHSRMRSS